MAVRIGSNISSLTASRRLAESSNSLSKTFERLSTGQRINRASDDAAGLAIAQALSTNSRVYTQAMRNVNDGLSYLNIADGALSQLSNITTRQLELAEQAANGVYTYTQRKAIASEANALVNEYNRIVQSTEFNGRKLLDAESSGGSVRIQAGYGIDGSLQMSVGDDLNRVAGTGEFQAAGGYDTESMESYDVVLGDINGDGHADLVSAGMGSGGEVTVRLNDGAGNFLGATSYAAEAVATNKVALSDLDGDGALDLITAGYGSGGTAMTVRLNDGGGNFGAATSYGDVNTVFSPVSLASGDINGDGFTDLVYIADGATAGTACFNDGQGGFASTVTFSSSSTTTALSLRDVNGDGTAELLIGQTSWLNEGQVSVMEYDGSGSFSVASAYTAANVTYTGITAGDLNGDGLLDLAVCGRNGFDGAITLLFNQGGGSFGDVSMYSSNCNLSNAIDLADVNGDGALDVITAGDGPVVPSITLRLNDGQGSFGRLMSVTTASPTVNRALSVADINGDGVPDIVSVGDEYGPGYVTVNMGVTHEVATIAALDLYSQGSAREALTRLRTQMERISKEAGGIGGFQSRLSVALNTLYSSRENATAAAARITDVDVAQESAALVSAQILQQAGAAILASANQQPALAVQLLKA